MMDNTPLNPANIKQGTDFYTIVKVKNPGRLGNYQEMALSQVFPAGWEIRNDRLAENDENNEEIDTKNYDYQDIRDDRVLTYFSLGKIDQNLLK